MSSTDKGTRTNTRSRNIISDERIPPLNPTKQLIPYKKLCQESSENLTKFEKFMKSKLNDPQAPDSSHDRSARRLLKMSYQERSLPYVTKVDKACVNVDPSNFDSKGTILNELQKENNSAIAQKGFHKAMLIAPGPRNNSVRSKSLGKLRIPIKSISRPKKSEDHSQKHNSERTPREDSLILNRKEKNDSFSNVIKVQQAYMSPIKGPYLNSKGILGHQFKGDSARNSANNTPENPTSQSLLQKHNRVNHVSESYNVIKSVHENSELKSPRSIDLGDAHKQFEEEYGTRDTIEITKGSLQIGQNHEHSYIQDGIINSKDQIDSQQIKKGHEDLIKKPYTLSAIVNSYRGFESDRGRIPSDSIFINNKPKRESPLPSKAMNSERLAPIGMSNSKSNSKERSQTIKNNNTKAFLPEWLEKRSDFKVACKEFAQQEKEIIPNACLKPSYARTPEELETMTNWLQKIRMLRIFPLELIQSIALKIKLRTFSKDQTFFQGPHGTCLYVVFSGMITCVIDGTVVAHYKAGELISQNAFERAPPGSVKMIAGEGTSILALEKEDYQFTMDYHLMRQRGEFLEIIKKINVFKDMEEPKQTLISAALQSKYYAKGEVIYNEGEGTEALYFLKQGAISIESNITIQKENLWPAVNGRHVWEKRTLVRNTKFSQMITPCSYFGEIELMKNCNRLYHAKCEEDSHVLILSRQDFFNLLDSSEIDKIKNLIVKSELEDVDKVKKSVIERDNEKHKMKKIMIRALTEQLSSLNPQEVEKKSAKMIKPTVEKVRKDFDSFLKQNTVKTIKKYEKVMNNAE